MIQLTHQEAEQIRRKLLIMSAATEALIHRLEEYNPDDEIAEGAAYSVAELRQVLEQITH